MYIYYGNFFIQRVYIEGIHMKQFYSCYLLSCVVIIFGTEISKFNIVPNLLALLIILICVYAIYKLTIRSSFKVPENELQECFLRKIKRIILLVVICTIMCYLVSYDVGLNSIMYCEIILLLSSSIKLTLNK